MNLTPDDFSFLYEMIEHHQCALQMAVLIDKSSGLYDFAQGIIKSQSADIEEMKGWLGSNIPGIVTNMSAEIAKKKIEKILSETIFD